MECPLYRIHMELILACIPVMSSAVHFLPPFVCFSMAALALVEGAHWHQPPVPACSPTHHRLWAVKAVDEQGSNCKGGFAPLPGGYVHPSGFPEAAFYEAVLSLEESSRLLYVYCSWILRGFLSDFEEEAAGFRHRARRAFHNCKPNS